MGSASRPAGIALTLAGLVTVAALIGPSATGASTRHCGSFGSQASAQTYFVGLGGGPRRALGGLDDDGDGVACEHLSAPYKGFAGFGYNARRDFFFGYARMPWIGAKQEFACLTGNKHFPEGPRRLNVYRVKPGPDEPLRDRKFGVGAEADTETGSLTWKIEARRVRGTYYMAFEERIALHPYGRNECPGFHSRTITLPAPPAPQK